VQAQTTVGRARGLRGLARLRGTAEYAAGDEDMVTGVGGVIKGVEGNARTRARRVVVGPGRGETGNEREQQGREKGGRAIRPSRIEDVGTDPARNKTSKIVRAGQGSAGAPPC